MIQSERFHTFAELGLSISRTWGKNILDKDGAIKGMLPDEKCVCLLAALVFRIEQQEQLLAKIANNSLRTAKATEKLLKLVDRREREMTGRT